VLAACEDLTGKSCACGEGVLDWARIVDVVRRKCPRDIVFSVEYGTPVQAAKSLEHLSRVLAG
jgi:sugar phosphate isomerase/epimerase